MEQADFKLSRSEFDSLSRAVYDHCGINLHDGKRELVEARLGKHIRQGGYQSAGAFIESVLNDRNGETFVRLIDTLSTNLTSFFREADHFTYLVREFLPRLIRDRKSSDQKRLRCWSAGCSSGEEPYTLGIVLQEAIPDLKQWDARILATDISTRVLERAERGVYDAARISGVPPQLRTRYFATNRYDGHVFFDALPSLRSLIAFRRLNLMETWPFSGPFDFIFCRNVMIYFDKPTQQALVNRFHSVLSPGGLLFTGHSESLTGVRHPFEYVRPTIYRKA
ncbi:CheR family methyltransferase [Humisphaera borealis]|nr:protein-glutamate O-methyltransferase CheR [Humisphaera borealis]